MLPEPMTPSDCSALIQEVVLMTDLHALRKLDDEIMAKLNSYAYRPWQADSIDDARRAMWRVVIYIRLHIRELGRRKWQHEYNP